MPRRPEARAIFHALNERKPGGYLAIGAALGEAEAAETLGDAKAAMTIYAALAESKISVWRLSATRRHFLRAGCNAQGQQQKLQESSNLERS